MQHSFQVWQEFINVLESFSYKDSLFINVINDILVSRKETKLAGIKEGYFLH